MDPNLEIRKLKFDHRNKLSEILAINDAWKEVMGSISMDGGNNGRKKYTADDVKLIQQEAETRKGKLAFDILIDEWGTSGRRRPTIQDLINILQSIKHYRAVEYLFVEVLQQDPPVPDPAEILSQEIFVFISGSAEPTPVDAPNIAVITQKTSLVHVPFSILKALTKKFSTVLGAGAFGTVFLGELSEKGVKDELVMAFYHKIRLPQREKFAVKLLHMDDHNVDIQRLFCREVETMSGLKHDNILQLLAYSFDGPSYCLVHKFMPNGSLDARLACKTDPLQWKLRLNICLGVAAALSYLHSMSLVHRDVKSANIFLDKKMMPKLGDFGLIKKGSRGNTTISPTKEILGTPIYMPPEAFQGDVTTKMDTYSFGVVILELMTGLPPCDERRTEMNLASHIEDDYDKFLKVLDPHLEPLDEELAKELYEISQSCLELKKRIRPNMVTVHERLKQVIQQSTGMQFTT